jgi:hypothetical protein
MVVAELAVKAGLDDRPFGRIIQLADLAIQRVDAVQQDRKGRAEIKTTPAPVTDVGNPQKLGIEGVGAPELRIVELSLHALPSSTGTARVIEC